MSQVKAHCYANDIELTVENGHASAPAMKLQAHIGAQRQANVVALGTFKAKLPAFNAGELLERAMLDFHQSCAVRQHFALGFGKVKAISSPIVRVAVWVNRPKHLDHAIAAQVNRPAYRSNVQHAHRLLLAGTNTHLAIALEPGQPVPTEVAHQLEIVQTAITLLKATSGGRNPRAFAC
jgi:hypothetical protein